MLLPKKIETLQDSENIADDVDLTNFDLMSKIDEDRLSMKSYLKKYENAIKLARMESEDEKTFPFVGASRVMMPYLMEAAVEFGSRASKDLLGTTRPCKVKTNDEKRGKRVAKGINALCTTYIKNWRTDTDRKCIVLAIVGTTFKKSWMADDEIKSRVIWAEDMIFDHDSECFDKAPRHSYEYTLSRNKVLEKIRSGEFVNIDIEILKDDVDEYTFIESHCWHDFDDDDYQEPYIVTIYKETKIYVSVVSRFDDIQHDGDEVESITGVNFFSQTIFIPDPFGSCMGMGYGTLMFDIYETLNTNARQLIDAGTLQNVGQNSGFIRSGALTGPRRRNRQRKGSVEMIMGKFTNLESYGTSPLANDIVNFPFAGPSDTLFRLMEALKLDVRNFANKVVEPNPNEAAELYLSRLQQEMIRPTSIMTRVYFGISQEFTKFYHLIRLYMTDEQYSNLIGEKATIEEDFAGEIDISTTADPSQGMVQERQARSKMIYEEAKVTPNIIDQRKAALGWLTSLGMTDEEAVELAPEPDPNAVDPQEELQKAYLEIEQVNAKAGMARGQAQMATAKVKEMEARMKAFELAFDTLLTEAKVENLGADSYKKLNEAGAIIEEANLSKASEEVDETFEQIGETDDRKRSANGVVNPPRN